MTVGKNIKKLRKEKGLTQQELTNICGIHKQTISRYERSDQNPRKNNLIKIADALGTDYFTLLSNFEPADWLTVKKYDDSLITLIEFKNIIYEACTAEEKDRYALAINDFNDLNNLYKEMVNFFNNANSIVMKGSGTDD